MLTWLHNLSGFAKLAGSVGLIAGAIVSGATAWPIVEPIWYVSRSEFRQVMDKQAIATDRQSVYILKEQLSNAQRDPAAQTSPVVRQRIQELQDELNAALARVRKATGGS